MAVGLLMAATTPTVLAQQADSEPFHTKESMFAFGAVKTLDTYLSPEQYSGSALSFISTTRRRGIDNDTRQAKRWTRQYTWRGYLNTSSNRADNGNYLGGDVGFQFDALRDLPLFHNSSSEGVALKAGPMAEASLGGLYNTRNGNNPAQMHATLDVGVTLRADRDFMLFNKNFTIGYEASLPLLGMAFTPQYGQSYYEIFTQGDYDHNIVVTTPANALSLRHMLSVDYRPSPSHAFRIGYLGNYLQREANHLKTHDYCHMLVIGYVKNINLNTRQP